MSERDWTKDPPSTESEWLAFKTRATRYKANDGKERAVLLWEDYELILKLAGCDEAWTVD